ncbi:MAG: outer membrane beta-barrel protein, partial [Candidatus Omnitrophica bacterium]|nr:outer membrane beta-barrel protein [Candidatus Omnitrophota bacterium]
SLNRFKIESKYKLGRNDTLTMAYDNILSQFGPDYNYEDFFENHFDVGFSHSLTRRTALFSGFGYSNRHYPNDRGKDADRYPFRLGLRHALTRKLWAQFEFDYEYADYWRSDKTMNNFGGIVDLRYKFGRQTTGGLRYRYLTMPSWRNHFMQYRANALEYYTLHNFNKRLSGTGSLMYELQRDYLYVPSLPAVPKRYTDAASAYVALKYKIKEDVDGIVDYGFIKHISDDITDEYTVNIISMGVTVVF